MFRFTAIMLAFSLAFTSANAEETALLKKGDIITADFGDRLSVRELRDVLYDRGYFSLGFGSVYGRILIISAYASDENRYLIKVHSTTGEVLDAHRARNFWT